MNHFHPRAHNYPNKLGNVTRLLSGVVFVFVIHLGNIQSVSAFDGEDTLVWIRSVNDKYLEYHCRIRFGDDPTKLSFNGALMSNRWQEVTKILDQAAKSSTGTPWKQIDNNLINYYRFKREYELLVQKKERELRDKLGYLLLRGFAEELGGEDVQKMYDAMPDNWDIKQDIPGFAADWIKAGWSVNEFHIALSKLERHVKQTISEKAGEYSQPLLREFNRLRNGEEVAKYEKQWLEKNRPALLDSLTIKAGAQLTRLHELLDPLVDQTKLDAMARYGKTPAQRFLYHWYQCQQYEKQQLPWLAVDELNVAAKTFWAGYRDAMESKASALEGQGKWFESLQTLAHASVRSIRIGRFDRTEIVAADPLDSGVLPKQVKIADGRLGFLGGIELPVAPTGIQVTKDGKTAVVLSRTGLLTYDLVSGKRKHLIFDLPSDIQLGEFAVAPDGKHAYVVSTEPAIIRYDLVDGKRDGVFPQIPVKRRDTKLAISPDGKYLATALISKINLYQTDDGKHLGETSGMFNSLIYGISFAGDGKRLYSHGNTTRIKFADINGNSGGERRIGEKGYVYSLINRADGMMIASGSGLITVWNGRSEQPVFHVKLPEDTSAKIRWADLTPDHGHVISANGIWEFESAKLVYRFHPSWDPELMALHPDGSRMIICRGKGMFVVPLALTHPDKIAEAMNRSAVTQTEQGTPTKSQKMPNEESNQNSATQGRYLLDKYRQWVDSTGQFKTRAKLVSLVNNKVKLEKPDGSTIEVEVKLLSARDQKFLKQLVDQ